MASPKTLKYLSGVIPEGEIQYDPPGTPLDQGLVAQTILQLQNTVNELIAKHNALCVSTTQTGDEVTGAGAAATGLFTAS